VCCVLVARILAYSSLPSLYSKHSFYMLMLSFTELATSIINAMMMRMATSADLALFYTKRSFLHVDAEGHCAGHQYCTSDCDYDDDADGHQRLLEHTCHSRFYSKHYVLHVELRFIVLAISIINAA
jgi:hypothetical protein